MDHIDAEHGQIQGCFLPSVYTYLKWDECKQKPSSHACGFCIYIFFLLLKRKNTTKYTCMIYIFILYTVYIFTFNFLNMLQILNVFTGERCDGPFLFLPVAATHPHSFSQLPSISALVELQLLAFPSHQSLWSPEWAPPLSKANRGYSPRQKPFPAGCFQKDQGPPFQPG